MAEEFINQGVVCSANWWNSSRSALFAGGMSQCSGAGADLGSFGWPVEANDIAGLASSTNSDWNQALLFGGEGSCNRIRTPSESNFSSNNFMHESGSSDNSSQVHNDWSPGMVGNFAGKPVDDHEDASPMSSFKNHMGFPTQPPDSYGSPHRISSSSSSCGYTSDMIKSFLLDQPDLSSVDHSSAQFMAGGYGSRCSDESSPASFGKLPSLLKPINSSLPNPPQPSKLHLSNNMPYWHASSSVLDDIRAGLFGPPQSTLVGNSPEEKPNRSISKANSQYPRVSGQVAEKKANPEPAFKRVRIETPSPLPTFKVRKEKLGDRITALQQLVSPFGKTDTASVLHEAIEYIKFLHDQVHVLSSPYMKNGVQVQHQQACTDRKAIQDSEVPKTDLRSRGLCLVPISSTFPVASETPADFWTPTFVRSFR